MTHRPAGRRARPAVVISLLVLGLIAGCSSSGSSSGGSTPRATAGAQQAPTTTTGGGIPAALQAKINALYKGNFKPPSSAPRPAVKGKKIVIISAGQSSISSSIPVSAAEAAARAMGWQVRVYDGQLNPANAAPLMQQAINSGADGIIVDSIDCPLAKAQFQEAKARGIAVVPIFSFDCDDPIFGKARSAPLFSGSINYGYAVKNSDAETELYGAKQADAVIAATHGHARVIFVNDLEVTVLKYTGEGFLRELAKCSGCKVVDTIDFTGTELGPALQQKMQAALLKYPDANAVKSPYTSATVLSIAPAVVQSGRSSSIYVMGGEGYQPELDLMRAHQGVSAVMVTPGAWTGWAAVDTMNSLFRHEKPAFSGLGNQLVDDQHGLPPSGTWAAPYNYQAIYEKAWGVGP